MDIVNRPTTTICPRTPQKPPLDHLEHPLWQAAPWIETWTEIRGDETAPTTIKAKLLYDETHLYLAAQMQEPHLWATQTEHDASVWLDNAFELFLDPNGDGHNYLEWEVNCLGTTLDLSMDRPYICGGTMNPELEIPGLELAILADGSVNDPSSKATGWEFGAAIPWKALTQIDQEPPQAGDIWRFNLMKCFWPVEVVDGTYQKSETEPEKYWCLAPTGVVDIHRPWFWAYLQFAESADQTPYKDPDWDTKLALCQALGFTSRARADGPNPKDSLYLQPNQTLIDHPSGYAVQTSGYQLSADGRLTQSK